MTVPMLETNYAYIIVDKSTQKAALVDPAEPEKLIKYLYGLDLQLLLTTHHHEYAWKLGLEISFSDHSAGNGRIKETFPSIKVCGADTRIPRIEKMVHDRESIKLGNLRVEALLTPCHTTGSVCWVIHDDGSEPSAQAVFTGDTLFLAGCGYFFEGTGADMNRALNQVLAGLPGTCRVFVGHEYTINNLEFAHFVEPSNLAIWERLDRLFQQKSANRGHLISVPGSISEELATNPFMRLRNPEIAAKIGITGDDSEAMSRIREIKNSFKNTL